MGVLAHPDPTEEEIARVERNLIDFVIAGVVAEPALRAAGPT
jgi:hypothetical protein